MRELTADGQRRIARGVYHHVEEALRAAVRLRAEEEEGGER